jgi:N-acetylneuraminic acid mutarotase
MLHTILLTFALAGEGGSELVNPWPMLPRPVASFGAVSDGNWLYVYGGHVGKPHEHSTANVNGEFQRLNLLDGRTWQSLAPGTPLQSPALVAFGGKIVRAGGMTPKNAPGEKEDLDSTREAASYDPLTKAWSPLPPLPEARSSHDAAVLGNHVYVMGGWTLTAGKGAWLRTAHRLDLTSESPKWEALPEAPFERRACAVAACQGKIFVLGGIGSDGKTSRRVDVYDPAKSAWAAGPELPWDGFGIAAIAVDGILFASAREGRVHRLGAGGAWEEHSSLTIPRFFHRFVALDKGRFAAVGGAGTDGGHLRLVEPIRVKADAAAPEVTAFSVPYPGAARNRQGVFVVKNELVLFGGNNSTGQHDFAPENFVGETWKLHLGTLEWSRGADFPAHRQSMQTIQVPGSAGAGDAPARGTRLTSYALGGFGHNGEAAVAMAGAFEYGAGTSPWAPLDAELPEPRTQFGSAARDGALYIFGGLDYDPRRGKENAFQYPSRVVKLDVGGGPVEAAASRPAYRDAGIEIPRVRRAFGGAQLGDRFYMVCGMRQEFQLVEECDVYDFASKTWETIPSPSRPRISPELVALDGKLYLIGGSSPKEPGSKSFERNPSIEVYDPAAKAWSTLLSSLPVPAEHVRALAFNGRLVLFSVDPADGSAFRLAFVKP